MGCDISLTEIGLVQGKNPELDGKPLLDVTYQKCPWRCCESYWQRETFQAFLNLSACSPCNTINKRNQLHSIKPKQVNLWFEYLVFTLFHRCAHINNLILFHFPGFINYNAENILPLAFIMA